MRNKKADFLVDNALSIIIAVIGIGLLIFGAVRLYQVGVSGESESAKELASVLEEKINRIESGQTAMITIRGPGEKTEWYLTGWSKDDPYNFGRCFPDSCICVCGGSLGSSGGIGQRNLGQVRENQINECRENGFCRKFDQEVVVKTIRDETLNDRLTTYEDPFIKLPSNLVELTIRKTNDLIEILIGVEANIEIPSGPIPL